MVPVLTSRRASELPISEAACVLKVRTSEPPKLSPRSAARHLSSSHSVSGGANGCTANTGCPNFYRNSNCSVSTCDANTYNVNGSDAYSSSTKVPLLTMLAAAVLLAAMIATARILNFPAVPCLVPPHLPLLWTLRLNLCVFVCACAGRPAVWTEPAGGEEKESLPRLERV